MSRQRLAKLEQRRRARHGDGKSQILIYRYAQPFEDVTPEDQIPTSVTTIWIPDNGRGDTKDEVITISDNRWGTTP